MSTQQLFFLNRCVLFLERPCFKLLFPKVLDPSALDIAGMSADSSVTSVFHIQFVQEKKWSGNAGKHIKAISITKLEAYE